MINLFWEKIEQYNNIVIFRHINPDGDAYGSQYGLANFLKSCYKNKNIYCVGNDNERKFDIFPKTDIICDDLIKSSLAIVCDTSTVKRIDDTRCFLAKDILKFDHHLHSEGYTNLEIIDETAASCSEVIAQFISTRYDLAKLDNLTAKYLFTGIASDTLNFTTTNTNKESFEICAKLIQCGLNVNEIDYNLHKKSNALIKLTSEFNGNYVVDDKFAYGFISKELRDKYGQSVADCKDLVTEFSKVIGLSVWAVFTESDKNDGLWNASLRSRGVAINEIASKYGGGGHKNAAGADYLSLDQVTALIEDLQQASKQ